jgi:hypothetical protein
MMVIVYLLLLTCLFVVAQEKHPSQYAHFTANRCTRKPKTAMKRKHDEKDTENETLPIKRKVQKLVNFGEKETKIVSQKQFEHELLSMLLEDMQPLATVERTGFMKFISNLLPYLHIPSRRTLGRRIDDLYKTEKEMLIKELQCIQHLSVSIDLWSSHKRAFMGITLHYVDEKSLQIVSHALGCRRFKYSHTGNKVAEMMTKIFDEFKISTKITCCVTDNATNMVKALRILGDLSSAQASSSDHSQDTEGEEDDTAGDNIEVIDYNEKFQINTGSELDYEVSNMLHKHIRCATHTLNLVAAVDSREARKDDKYKRMYDKAMGKVQALSNAVSRSTIHADEVEDTIGLTFLNPTSTRWSSDYSAVKRIVDVGIEKVGQCQQAIGLATISEPEFTFLQSYVKVMKPIASAIDFLQGEKTCFLGHVIPTVTGIKKNMQSLNVVATMKPLVAALLNGLTSRFADVLNDDQYHVATMLIPKFKLRYLPESEQHVKKAILVATVLALSEDVQDAANGASGSGSQEIAGSSSSTTGDLAEEPCDLFAFMDRHPTALATTESNSVLEEIDRYFASTDGTLESLRVYPRLAKTFLKYNSSVPSSAAVERLFSCAGQILVPRRCKVGDKMFDKLVFLRYKLKKI